MEQVDLPLDSSSAQSALPRVEAPSPPSLIDSYIRGKLNDVPPLPNLFAPSYLSCSSHRDNVTMAEAGAGEMLGAVDDGTSKGSVF